MGTNNACNTAITVSASRYVSSPVQGVFYVYPAGVLNVTGDGTNYKRLFTTEVKDINNDFSTVTSTYTAPVSGRIFLAWSSTPYGLTASHTSGVLQFVTSNRTYSFFQCNRGAIKSIGDSYVGQTIRIFTDVDAGDTVTCNIQINGGTKVVDIGSRVAEGFAGSIIC